MARAGVAAGLVIAGLLLLVGSGGAQESFNVTYKVDRSNPQRTRISGAVANTGRVDVVDVYVTAEALDSGGKVIGRGIAFVSPNIPQGATAPFEALVPVGARAANFRVKVTSYRLGTGAEQAP
jgi:hypothetical protein